MMEFLYFPEDKSEYIPAVITLAIFMVGAVVTMYLFYKKSKKDEAKIDEQFKDKEHGYKKELPDDDESKSL